MSKENKTVEAHVVEQKHSKENLLKAKVFNNRKDILRVLLEEGKEYTTTEVNILIEKFMNTPVK